MDNATKTEAPTVRACRHPGCDPNCTEGCAEPVCWYCDREVVAEDDGKPTCEQCHEDLQRGAALARAWADYSGRDWKDGL